MTGFVNVFTAKKKFAACPINHLRQVSDSPNRIKFALAERVIKQYILLPCGCNAAAVLMAVTEELILIISQIEWRNRKGKW